jgi:UDP-glucose 4-epimerase
MNILITGVNGFIGQHASRLLATKHRVFGVTRGLTSTQSQSAFQLVYADLSDPTFVDLLPSNVDCVIHLAQSSHYRNFPIGAHDMRCINIDSVCRLLEWARKSNVKKFIFTSTANVYAKSSDLLTESHSIHPESFYGATKLTAEYLMRQYQSFFQIYILRLFTVYGPDQKGMLISNIIERIRTGQPITLAEGTGLFITPIYVDDVVTTLMRLIETPSKAPIKLLNVCGNRVLHLKEIVNLLEVTMGLQANLQLTDQRAPHLTGSNEALRSFLGMVNFTEIEAGLELTLNSGRLTH